jgi:hypothetical protein
MRGYCGWFGAAYLDTWHSSRVTHARLIASSMSSSNVTMHILTRQEFSTGCSTPSFPPHRIAQPKHRRHAAISEMVEDSPARWIVQSVACWALLAAVNMAFESGFRTLSHELIYCA